MPRLRRWLNSGASIGGKFGGIGIQTQWIRDSLVVTSLLSGGAAEEAGIRPDDRIVRVDGRAVKEIPASEPSPPCGEMPDRK